MPLRAALTAVISPPSVAFPHETTDPSVRKAAKAELVDTILVTSIAPERAEETEELLPPLFTSPHVTTEPSANKAAKADVVEATVVTGKRDASREVAT